MYGGYMFEYQYGFLQERLNCGASTTDLVIRFPDDPFDRTWPVPDSSSTIDPLKTSAALALGNDDFDQTPEVVMQSAWMDHSFWFSRSFPLQQKYYVAFYFAELQQNLNATDTRVLDVTLNGEPYFSNLTVPPDGSARVIWDNAGATGAWTILLNFSFQAHARSTLPPILNAYEIHKIYASNTSTTDSSDRAAIDDIRQSLNLMDWTGDPCFPVSYDWVTCSHADPALVTQLKLSRYQLQGTIPPSIAKLSALTDLWLDDNAITGTLPDLSTLTTLQTLHLQNNSLTGQIPESLADISTLIELDLRDNHFNGTVPAALVNKNGLVLRVDPSNSAKNPSPPPTGVSLPASAPGPSPRSKSTALPVAIGAIAAGVVLFILSLVLMCICVRKRRTWTRFHESPSKAPNQQGNQAVVPLYNRNERSARAFTLIEVQKITNNWEKEIGKGGYGSVYCGQFEDGSKVAVKKCSESSAQGSQEFAAEVSLLSRIHHRNLVHLIGYCNESNNNILIYDFMTEGTLQEHLYNGKDFKEALDWPTRLRIAIEAARGLEYLHYDCNPRIVHRDVKSTNILLDENLQAKMADFGLSKVHEEDKAHSSCTHRSVKGTLGYMDPEYLQTSIFTYKSDVYAFGVVLLEMISGRPPIIIGKANVNSNLADIIRQMLYTNRLEEVADPSLQNYNKEAMWKVAELAMRCVEHQSVNRPDMREVVGDLCEAATYREETIM